MNKKFITPDAIFEVSWEVCNKVGGIHTVISTKALSLIGELKDKLIMIGPDVYRDGDNPEFEEDHQLYSKWKEKARQDGISVRVGRWKVKGTPVVMLIDFTPYIAQKDEIFSKFWESYKLDSISGQWDYIEPVLFGVASAKMIEHFCNFHFASDMKVVAQFHEWMTGSGVLYLEQEAAHIATSFTTHATILGRCIAGNNRPLYKNMELYNPDQVAREFNVVSKNSMETLAAQHADVFTTVSSITAKECAHFLGKEVDIVTPNGFEDNFVPKGEEFTKKRLEAKKVLRHVTESLLGYELPKNVKYIATSGRYEFRNKGLDLYIESLKQLNESSKLKKEIVAFILVPAHNYGAQKELVARMNGEKNVEVPNRFSTHGLHYADHDPVLNKISSCKLTNSKEDKVKVILVPHYLNLEDGIFNISYYDLLIGLDLTVFPSYYEPWGYTPMESLAFHVPTITTSLAGFGMWVKAEADHDSQAVKVVERTDSNDDEVVVEIKETIEAWVSKSDEDFEECRNEAREISRIALWKNLVKSYKEAYTIALSKVDNRIDRYLKVTQTEQPVHHIKKVESNAPIWKTIKVESTLPDRIAGLRDLAYNLWWSWNEEAVELFKDVDSKIFEEVEFNPVMLLNRVSLDRYKHLIKDDAFLSRYDGILNKFKTYMSQSNSENKPCVAYFSMEFGFTSVLKIYSGGLGILAGDYLKEASDQNYNIVGIGLLYRQGYFKQELSLYGEQMATYEMQKFSNLPIFPEKNEDGSWKKISVVFPGRTVYARLWRVQVGRIKLYLLDTDIEDNQSQDRGITAQLYGGDWEHRLKQELILGIGGIRAIDQLQVKPDIYHCNEGHAAFTFFERLHKLMKKRNFTFAEAIEILRSSSLFTTHTPVPAGHDAFNEGLLRTYLSHYPERFKISWDDFMGLGRANVNDKNEHFSMSHLAAKLSQEVNGVSWLHGEVTKDMFNNLWPAYNPEELHIGYVTNGVHLPTWTAPAWKKLYNETFGENYIYDQSNHDIWKKIYEVPDEKIWAIRQNQRKLLIDYIKERLDNNFIRRRENPKILWEVKNALDDKALIIGFARRFATYKRAYLLFNNLDKLSELVNNEKQPIRFIFAGKAHPNDKPGQDLIKYIVEVSRKPEFIGKIIFLENYDIKLAKMLVQGVDIWMNTPTRPLEASGTSGMKAIMNGVMNLSILDGWWVEGYKEGAGWALTEKNSYENPAYQDELDAETIYSLIEHDVLPKYYNRNSQGIPEEWVKYVKNCIAQITPDFTTKRMLDDYIERFYNKLYKRAKAMKDSDYLIADYIAKWKQKVSSNWDNIHVVKVDLPDTITDALHLGDKLVSEVVLDIHGISEEDLGVELVIADSTQGKVKIYGTYEYQVKQKNGNRVTYEAVTVNPQPGIYSYGVRIFPKNPELPHRQDFGIVKWIG